jgi:peptide alpha-N-acetyltransferase
MLVVNKKYRRQGIGRELVKRAIDLMIANGAQEVVLETEGINTAALHLYESMGFVRDKRIHAYYLNGEDAYRLKLWV